MQAIVQSGYGAPDQVLAPRDIDPPVYGDDDVLIRVHATSVNTPDWIFVTGTPQVLRLQFGLSGPKAPVRGSDVAGVVEAVGAHVTDFQPGDEVFGSVWTDAIATCPGTFAELTVAPAARLAIKPPELSFEDAAGAVMSGLTALVAIRDVAHVGPGMRVLVNGASGGVGTFAVQIAHALGAHVTGVCSTRNIDLVRSLGADEVIDYTVEDFTEGPFKNGRERYDVILDNVVNHSPDRVARALAQGGLLMPNSVGNTGGLFAGLPRMARAWLLGRGSTRVEFPGCKYDRAYLEDLAELIVSGRVSVVVDSVYPLQDASSAVARMLSHRASGQVVITVP